MSRTTLLIIFVAAAAVCAWDAYVALHARPLSWILAAIMALIAIAALRKMLRRDYSGSWW